MMFWEHPERDIFLKSIQRDFIQSIFQALNNGGLIIPFNPKYVANLQHEQTDFISVSFKHHSHLSYQDGWINLLHYFKQRHECSKSRHPIHLFLTNAPKSAENSKETEHVINSPPLDKMLVRTSIDAAEIALMMALICKKICEFSEKKINLSVEKAFLIGLFSNIGLLATISASNINMQNGHYLEPSISEHMIQTIQSEVAISLLKYGRFDQDFISIFYNQKPQYIQDDISYFDIKKMAIHLRMFRTQDENIDSHEIELTLAGAETMYELSNLSDDEFKHQLFNMSKYIHQSAYLL